MSVLIQVDRAVVEEGQDGAFTVRLSEASATPVTVQYRLLSRDSFGTLSFSDLIGGSDFDEGQVYTLTFQPGETIKTIPIRLDSTIAGRLDQHFTLELFNAINAEFAGEAEIMRTQGFALDDGFDGGLSLPIIAVGSPIILEGDSGVRTVRFEVSLSRPAPSQFTVNFTTADGSALANQDYRARSGTLTFLLGQTTAFVEVEVLGDTAIEANESFFLQITPQAGANYQVANLGTATLVNNDTTGSAPSIQVDRAVVEEGQDGAFTVRLSEASATPVTVQYRLLSRDSFGTLSFSDLIGGSDFDEGQVYTLTFQPGETIKTIPIRLDSTIAGRLDQHFTLELFNAINAEFAGEAEIMRTQGFALDDGFDGGLSLPIIAVGSPIILEGDSGVRTVRFEVSLSRPAPSQFTVNFTTADGSALANQDYRARSGTLTFLPGQTTAFVEVEVLGDTAIEANESFFLQITPQAGANYQVANLGTATLVNNDTTGSAPSIQVDRAVVEEGQDGAFTVRLSEASATPVTVQYRLLSRDSFGTLSFSDLIGGSDFDEGQVYTLTFQPGETIKTIPIRLDSTIAGRLDQHFTLELFNAINAEFAGEAEIMRTQGFALDDGFDGGLSLPIIAVGSPIILEGDSGVRTVRFEVSLSRPAPSQFTVNFTTADGSALANQDYRARSGTLTFLLGQTTAFVEVEVLGDTAIEANESFFLQITPQAGANYQVANLGTATIVSGVESSSISSQSPPALLISDSEGSIYTWNLQSGAVTKVVATGRFIADLAVSPSGVIYFITNSTLFRIDNLGVPSQAVVEVARFAFSDAVGFDIGPDGTALITRSQNSGIFAVNLSTGATTQVATLAGGKTSAGDIAIDPDGAGFSYVVTTNSATIERFSGTAASQIFVESTGTLSSELFGASPTPTGAFGNNDFITFDRGIAYYNNVDNASIGLPLKSFNLDGFVTGSSLIPTSLKIPGLSADPGGLSLLSKIFLLADAAYPSDGASIPDFGKLTAAGWAPIAFGDSRSEVNIPLNGLQNDLVFAESIIGGERTLAFAFSGTQNPPVDFITQIVQWAELYAGHRQVIIDVLQWAGSANSRGETAFTKMIITGHSLGGILVEELLNDQTLANFPLVKNAYAVTFGSPGSPREVVDDARLLNFVTLGDPVALFNTGDFFDFDVDPNSNVDELAIGVLEVGLTLFGAATNPLATAASLVGDALGPKREGTTITMVQDPGFDLGLALLPLHSRGGAKGYAATIADLEQEFGLNGFRDFAALDFWLDVGPGWYPVAPLDFGDIVITGIGATLVGTFDFVVTPFLQAAVGVASVEKIDDVTFSFKNFLDESISKTITNSGTVISGAKVLLNTTLGRLADLTEVVYQGTPFFVTDVRASRGSAILEIDADGDGLVDITTTFTGEYDLDRFFVAPSLEQGSIFYSAAVQIEATSGGDRIFGSAAAEVLQGLAGDDLIFGSAGSDTLRPGQGKDRVGTGLGADRIEGMLGELNGDTIFDLSAEDTIVFLGAQISLVEVRIDFGDTNSTVPGPDYAMLSIDDGLDGVVDAQLLLFGNFENASFSVAPNGANTLLKVSGSNSAPAITFQGGASNASVNVDEGSLTVARITAQDNDKDLLTFEISGGADADKFTIDRTSGSLAFLAQPPFQMPGDISQDNVYDVVVSVSDGLLSATQSLAVNILPTVQQVTITSNAGGDSAAFSVPEGQSAVTQVLAIAPAGTTVSYAIAGGADASRFTINPQTGQLSFVAVPDFERPTDSGGDNVYQVIVSASDGSLSDTQTLSVTIEDRSVAPRLIAPDGFAGGIGGTTAVFLTSGFQDIRFVDAPGTITLSGAPGGDDIIRFAGAASAYTITRVGSRVDIADGDTRVSIPVSPTSINVVFADGPRTLGIVNGQVRIGSQLVSNAGAAITAPAEIDPLPNLADPAVRGRLIVAEGSPVTVAGKIDVFGTSFDNELFVAAGGDVAIRGGFTGGMDTVGFMGPASDYTAVRSGSTVLIETNGTRVSIPISPTGTKLLFGSEDRLLKVDTVTGKTLIGTQEIGASPTPLTTSLQTSSIDASDVTGSISPNGGDLMALAPDSFEEMLAFADANSSTGPQRLIDMAESGGLADTQADLQRLLSDVSGFDPLGPADMLRLYYATAYTGMFAQAYLALDDDALMDLHQSGSQFGGLAPSPVMLASFDSFAPGG
ncbi:Calx-beta domain-containing protein [Erythrobacter sp. W302b]|uniref:Calx-beta domain-containing protein n=1 Tax=Erythrobacter sp. W302b TaxID=3389874 RepID=UPI00396AF0C5